MHRLLVPSKTLNTARATLPADAAHHLKVLRPRTGEPIELFDGRGHTRAYAWSPEGLTAAGERRTFPPPAAALTLFACVTKGSRWDWTVEKAVELGVTRLVPVISERCVVRLSPEERPSKAERWRRIAEDAARQSDAVYLPEVLPAVDFEPALDLVRSCTRVYAGALQTPPAPPLVVALKDLPVVSAAPLSLGLFVGPEGDFTPAELERLLTCAVPVSFGPTVLRAETAAIFGISVLSAVLDSFRLLQPVSCARYGQN